MSSSREKPRPARTRRLYLTVGQRTMGLSLSIGRGARAAALAARASRRRCLRPGCNVQEKHTDQLKPFFVGVFRYCPKGKSGWRRKKEFRLKSSKSPPLHGNRLALFLPVLHFQQNSSSPISDKFGKGSEIKSLSSYLLEVHLDTTIPILVEVCEIPVSSKPSREPTFLVP